MATPGKVPGMRWVPGGEFLMGSEDFYPEEGPVHKASVHGFWMDESPVTVAQFRRFAEETGYTTVAERPLDPADFPGADPALLVPGSLVFHRTDGPVDLRYYGNWWRYVPGAAWHRPDGSRDGADGDHPVTQVAHEDVLAYARWAGKDLPTETEWEFAARGGLEGAVYVWGDQFAPEGRMMANTWQGEFPWQNLLQDGYEGTSPVGSFPANGYGLYDMAGNVWEWTSDLFTARHSEAASSACCAPSAPSAVGPGEGERRTIKGGSHLCAPNYCLRYRPAARQGQEPGSSTSHLGFRCVLRP